MAFVSGSVPNLIGGVSQQPADIRALNCSTALSNTWSDVVTGLSTRPPAEFLGTLGLSPTTGKTVATHVINKDDGDYLVAVYDGAVHVAKLDGTFAVHTVTVVGGADAYISGVADCAANIGFVTVGDTTFIYNRSMTVTKTATDEGSGLTGTTDEGVVRKNPNRYATAWVKQGGNAYDNFTLYYNGVQVANASSGQYAESDDTAASLETQLDAAGYPTTRPGQTVCSIQLTTEGDYITGRDDFGDQGMTVYNDVIEEFTDLPNIDLDGRLVLVENGIEEDSDDYWVWFTKERWVETYGWSAYEKIDDATMPIILVHNGGTDWQLQYTTYPGREVGDEDSNPTPSFVNSTIRSMFLYKGRMVILSDENFIASRISNFENFYRQTCTQLLDEDPIDIASANSRGAPLNFGKEFDKELLLFTAYDQFRISTDSEGLLSPNTVTIRKSNSYNNSPDVEPAFIGPNVAFVDDFGARGFASMREYQIDRNFGTEVALPITDGVPEYLRSGIYKLVGSSTYSNLVLVSTADRTKVWLYNYYFNNEGKVQSAWQHWVLNADIYSVDYSRDTLIIVADYEGSLRVLKLVFDAGADTILDKGSISLDFGCEETVATAALVGANTAVTLPFDVAAADEANLVLVVSPLALTNAGKTYTPDSIAGNVATFNDVDLTAVEYVIGFKYSFSWQISPIFLRDKNQVAIQDGRLQLRRVSLRFNNSGPFETSFVPTARSEFRSTYEASFTGVLLGGSYLGEVPLDSGEFRVACNGNGETLDLTVSAWTPWRVRFSTLEWEGVWRPKKRRM